MEDNAKEEILKLQAEFCKSLASPKRLRIVEELKLGPCSVGELGNRLGLKQSSTSQLLAILRKAGVIRAERHGNTVYYSLSNPRVISACENVRSIIAEELERRKRLGELI